MVARCLTVLLGPLEDLVRFGQMHLNDGVLDGRRVLSVAGAREMRRPRNDDFALGFERFPDGWLGHDGQAGGYRASFRLHPERGEGYASLAATGDGR